MHQKIQYVMYQCKERDESTESCRLALVHVKRYPGPLGGLLTWSSGTTLLPDQGLVNVGNDT